MFIIGLFGICLLVWYFLQFMWGKVIPALIFIVPFLMILGTIIDHPFWTLLLAVVAFVAWGMYLAYRDEHPTAKMQQQAIKDQEKAAEDADTQRVIDAADKALHSDDK
ncbi:hypothetical protein [Leuconostoc citreum]|uniref:hypothetical protein n=1 Tax=Leuconostoc citreum TaxID=33964 RepID=UPI001C201525|nr:hypothetical protein [Leuconostoc citreum]MBU7451535.1 hypothetical protein [Leuconostoc citreum]